MRRLWLLFLLLIGMAGACGRDDAAPLETAVEPTPTIQIIPTTESLNDPNFIIVATDAPNPPFTSFDEFGEVTGFSATTFNEIAALAGLNYELVVTPTEGVLETVAAGSNKDFDAVLTNLTIPDQAQSGIAYTQPYLEVGQALVVLVDNREIESFEALQPGMQVGVAQGSWSEQAAIEHLSPLGVDIIADFDNEVDALQHLIDEGLTAVLLDSPAAEYFTTKFPDQIKIVGGQGRDAWITQRAYGIAVASDNVMLLTRLNQAIESIQNSSGNSRSMAFLIPDDTLIPGEPRAGTSTDELVIGMLGSIGSLDPAGPQSLIDWELKSNIMSGLYRVSPTNSIEPLLASGPPAVSEDGLEITVRLRQDVHFPDGTELTAEDVKWSIDRSRSLGSFLVNGFLKDEDDNGFADDDAVQIVSDYVVKFVLQEPVGYFSAVLATPPYFPVSNECFTLAQDNGSRCGGIGPYTISQWESGNQIELAANPEWPGSPSPLFDNITIRFFDDAPSIRRSLEQFQSIDLIWTGVPYDEMQAIMTDNEESAVQLQLWQGDVYFKSYLVFDHQAEPWDKTAVRLAAAYAIDRNALAALFNGSRSPLFSPVPETVPGHAEVLPARNLPQARTLLAAEGFNQANPLLIEIWYVNDGRYSAIEAAYANEIKRQLEETGVFQVLVTGVDFETFRQQIAVCNYPAYLLGWPSPGQSANFLDATSWMDFFIEATDSVICSNYESSVMTQLSETALEQRNETERLNTYQQMQQLWAQEFPTLDLLQEYRFAVGLATVQNVEINGLGLLHYELLSKQGG